MISSKEQLFSHIKAPGSDLNNPSSPAIICVSSGKGGTGKTLTIINMALSLSKLGKKVLIFDGDLGMSNVDVILNLRPSGGIEGIFDNNLMFKDIIVHGPEGIDLVPSGSGVLALQKLDYVRKEILREQLEEVSSSYDLLLIDTGAGINENVMYLNSLATDRVIVTTPEPHALTDAYAMVKVLAKDYRIRHSGLVVNMTSSAEEAANVSERFRKTAKKFSDAEVALLGFIPKDETLRRKVMRRKVDSQDRLNTRWGQAWHQASMNLLRSIAQHRFEKSSSSNFWSEAVHRRQESVTGTLQV